MRVHLSVRPAELLRELSLASKSRLFAAVLGVEIQTAEVIVLNCHICSVDEGDVVVAEHSRVKAELRGDHAYWTKTRTNMRRNHEILQLFICGLLVLARENVV